MRAERDRRARAIRVAVERRATARIAEHLANAALWAYTCSLPEPPPDPRGRALPDALGHRPQLPRDAAEPARSRHRLRRPQALPRAWPTTRSSGSRSGTRCVWAVGAVAGELAARPCRGAAPQPRPAAASAPSAVLILLPWFLPNVVAGHMWALMLDPRLGVINDMLVQARRARRPTRPGSPIPTTALAAALVVEIWHGFPFFALLLLAGAQGHPARPLRGRRDRRRRRLQPVPARHPADAEDDHRRGRGAARDQPRQLARHPPDPHRRRARPLDPGALALRVPEGQQASSTSATRAPSRWCCSSLLMGFPTSMSASPT